MESETHGVAADSDVPQGATCRICRGEATDDNPLFHPCKCKGSIKFIHQSCLMEWVTSKNVDINKPGSVVKCDICHYPIHFKTTYDDNMPDTIPLTLLLTKSLGSIFKAVRLSLTLSLTFLLLIIGLPLTWNFMGKIYTFTFDNELPQTGNFWLSVLYGYGEQVPTNPGTFEIAIQLLNNLRFSILQIVMLVVIHIALYFQYDMVVREGIFNKMVYHMIGPRYTKEELMLQRLKEQFPAMDDNTIQYIVDLMKAREQRAQQQQQQQQDVHDHQGDEELQQRPRPQFFRLDNDVNHDDDEDDSEFNTDDLSSSEESDNEFNHEDNDGDDGQLPQLQQRQQERDDDAELEDPLLGQFERIRAVNELDALIDDNNPAQHENAPAFIPAPQGDRPRPEAIFREDEQEDLQQQAIVNIRLKLINIPKYYIIGVVVITFYQLISYFGPTYIGYGLLELYFFVLSIFWRGVSNLANICRLPMAYAELTSRVPYFGRFDALFSQYFTNTIAAYYQGYLNNTMKSSMILRALPPFTTYATSIALVCISSDLISRGYGPENGMKNVNKRFVFQLLFAIRCTLKVFALFSIELAGFPILAGLMIDISLLSPLMLPQNNLLLIPQLCSLWPAASWFLYWGVGTLYMYWFAKYIGMIRHYIIRQGVLFFIRSPDDPNIRILHDSLIHPMRIQLSRLSLSMFIYAMFILVGFGFHTRLLFPHLLKSQFLPLFNGLTRGPRDFLATYMVLHSTKVMLDSYSSLKTYVRQYWTRVFDICCRRLRLSSFILGKDIATERGYVLYRNRFYQFFASDKAKWSNPSLYSSPKTLSQARQLFKENSQIHAYFIPDGTLMRVPANDIISRNFVQTLFVPVTKDDKLLKPLDMERIKERSQRNNGTFSHLDEQNTEFDSYTVVYTPPDFRFRYSTLIVTVWLFASILFIGLGLASNTLSMLIFGVPITLVYFFYTGGKLAESLSVFNSFRYSSCYYMAFGLLIIASLLERYHRRLEARAMENEHIVPLQQGEELQDQQQNQDAGHAQQVDEQLRPDAPIEQFHIFDVLRNLFNNRFIFTYIMHGINLIACFFRVIVTSMNYQFVWKLFFRQFLCKHKAENTVLEFPSFAQFTTDNLMAAGSYLLKQDGLLTFLVGLGSSHFLFQYLVIYKNHHNNRAVFAKTLWETLYKPLVFELLGTVGATLVLQFLVAFLEYNMDRTKYTSYFAVMIFLTKFRLQPAYAEISWTPYQTAYYYIAPTVCAAFYGYKVFGYFRVLMERTTQNVKDEVYARGKTLENLEDGSH